MSELSDNVKERLAIAVSIWSDENLEGKPAILANAMYFRLEAEMLRMSKEIKETFSNNSPSL